jgi:hypothetical protein
MSSKRLRFVLLLLTVKIVFGLVRLVMGFLSKTARNGNIMILEQEFLQSVLRRTEIFLLQQRIVLPFILQHQIHGKILRFAQPIKIRTIFGRLRMLRLTRRAIFLSEQFVTELSG